MRLEPPPPLRQAPPSVLPEPLSDMISPPDRASVQDMGSGRALARATVVTQAQYYLASRPCDAGTHTRGSVDIDVLQTPSNNTAGGYGSLLAGTTME